MAKFPRGSGPLVSVLLPSRGRPKGLCEAIDSIHSLVKDKSRIEYLLKIDDDDAQSIEIGHRLESVLPLRMIVSPRGNGYLDIHLWAYQLSTLATGDWLFLFNDDARMNTSDWDEVLANVDFVDPTQEQEVDFLGSMFGMEDVSALICETAGQSPGSGNEFMFLRRKVVEVLGHYSLTPYCDRWMVQVMTILNKSFRCPIEIKHLHHTPEYTDETRKEVLKVYAKKIEKYETTWAKINDASVLMRYLDSKISAQLATAFT